LGRTVLHFNRNESEMMMNENILKVLNTNTEFYPQNLEQKFPHLLERMIKLWNSPQFDAYVNQLMLDKREHHRQGFPAEVASEILRLSIIHTEQYGNIDSNHG
jgi:hypothetical protein